MTWHRNAIVNAFSIAGALGNGSPVPYIASKGALNAVTLHFSRVLAPRVRVNGVCPGMITTRGFVEGIGREGCEKRKTDYAQTAPLARACTPEEAAEAVVWLADAGTVTGELRLMNSAIRLGNFGRVLVRRDR